MERVVKKIQSWKPKAFGPSAATSFLHSDSSSTVVCTDKTIDYAAYHLCVRDPILGNIICVGDNAPLVVLTSSRRRVVLPLRKGVRWLDVFVFAGTSSTLLLSPDCLLLVDYTQRYAPSALFPRDRKEGLFTSFHVPQGMTWGVVGLRNGSVMYWKLSQESDAVSLVWAEMTTNLLDYCRPYLSAQIPPSCGHVYFIDSNSTSPNSLVAVLSGVPGVCKWHIDETQINAFYSLPPSLFPPDARNLVSLAVCRTTPGGTYIMATTRDISIVFIWLNNGKKSKNKSVDVFWTVEMGCRLPFSTIGANSNDNSAREDMEENDEYSSCGIHIARSATGSSQVQSDKKCHMHLLLYSLRECVELVLDVEGKQLLQREDILAHVAAAAVESSVQSTSIMDKKETFAISRIIPCVYSDYWMGMWTEKDLDLLLLTSHNCSAPPILIQRCRSKRNVKSIHRLEEFPSGMNSSIVMMILSSSSLYNVWNIIQSSMTDKIKNDPNAWQNVLEGIKPQNTCPVQEIEDSLLYVGMFSDLSRGAVCFVPSSNECISIPHTTMEEESKWWWIQNSSNPGQDSQHVVLLEQSLPEAPQLTEMILRVMAYGGTLMVYVVHLSLSRIEPLVTLSIESLVPHESSSGNEDDSFVRTVVLVECRIERSGDGPMDFQLIRGGYSILLQLNDGSMVLVDLSGSHNKNEERGRVPSLVHYPSGLFPAGSSVKSLDTVWMNSHGSLVHTNSGETSGMCLALFCILTDQKGVIVWDMSSMRLLAYYQNLGLNSLRYNTVLACPPPPLPPLQQYQQEEQRTMYSRRLGEETMNNVILMINIMNLTATHGGEEGVVYLRDVFGRMLLLPVRIRYAPEESDGCCWHLKRDEESAEWHSVISTRSSTLRFCVGIINDEVMLITDKNLSLGKTLVPSNRIAIVETGPCWPFAAIEWHFCAKKHDDDDKEPTASVPIAAAVEEEEGERERERESGFSFHNTSSEREEAIVLLCGENRIDFFSATRLATGGNVNLPDALLCSFKSARVIEHFVVCKSINTVIVLMRDANRWRWLILLDLDTAEQLAESRALMHFATEEEEDLRMYPLLVDGECLHVYVVGRGGALGHLVFFTADGRRGAAASQPRNSFAAASSTSSSCIPAPPGFRAYRRLLPPLPTMKQEQGFLKRLMTPPWEEVALRIEEVVLWAVRRESFSEFHQRSAPTTERKKTTAAVGMVETPSPQRHEPGQERRELQASSRYAELKSTAARENVSLNEARRIMNENQARLHERGNRISQIADHSRELAKEASKFQDLARRLKEQQQNRWI